MMKLEIPSGTFPLLFQRIFHWTEMYCIPMKLVAMCVCKYSNKLTWKSHQEYKSKTKAVIVTAAFELVIPMANGLICRTCIDFAIRTSIIDVAICCVYFIHLTRYYCLFYISNAIAMLNKNRTLSILFTFDNNWMTLQKCWY